MFSLPDKLVLDVESFMGKKVANLETPKGKVTASVHVVESHFEHTVKSTKVNIRQKLP